MATLVEQFTKSHRQAKTVLDENLKFHVLSEKQEY